MGDAIVPPRAAASPRERAKLTAPASAAARERRAAASFARPQARRYRALRSPRKSGQRAEPQTSPASRKLAAARRAAVSPDPSTGGHRKLENSGLPPGKVDRETVSLPIASLITPSHALHGKGCLGRNQSQGHRRVRPAFRRKKPLSGSHKLRSRALLRLPTARSCVKRPIHPDPPLRCILDGNGTRLHTPGQLSLGVQ